ncbi:flagellar hook-associated protein 3 [Frigoribacterium faeni]|uniref:flagellin N-terminal helical domain-containing protein n=1 Tax=Frigoribacterium faeni TaxID=145483 RepID=UPI001FADED83|nr:flagellin [Frigoribacterium faeni]MCJ0702103.1 flagellar hook-associated protein 3 [Frigoribacterium faeni]
MISRVTDQMSSLRAQQHLMSSKTRVAESQDRASSLQRIGRPSDDPTGAAEAMRVKNLQAAAAQQSRNADDGDGWLSTADGALSAADSIMAKVRQLTLQGANTGATGPAALEAIAIELEGLKKDLLGTANTSYNGRSVFAGTSDAGVAWTDDYTHTGSESGTVVRRVGPETTVRVDADGRTAFGTGDDSVFRLIDDIVTDLRGGVNVSAHLADIDTRVGDLRGVQSSVGASHAQLLRAKDTLMDTKVGLEAQRSGIEDLDLGQAVLELKLQENSYQAALAVTARVVQTSLMDFLR